MTVIDKPLRRIRSFITRGRMTSAQDKAFKEKWPLYGLTPSSRANARDPESFDFEKIFKRNAPIVLEIGFGSGQSLLEIAKLHPEKNFIGIETHLPGIGALFVAMPEGLNNLRIIHADAVEVLQHCIPDNSLETIQIFFPDPWPKRKHRKRRLIQTPFVNLLASKLCLGGKLHLATDWEDYATDMMKVLSNIKIFENLSGDYQFSSRSKQRPIITKFEQRGLNQGNEIWELWFSKKTF